RVIEAIETFAQRPLTDLELLHGVDHAETRTKSEIVAAHIPDPQPRGADVGNPFQHAIDRGWDKDKRHETKAQAYKRKSAEWEAKRAAEAEQAAFDADPKRVKAVHHANQTLMGMKFDPDVTQVELEAAQARLLIATSGDLNEYRRLDAEYRDGRKLKIAAAQA